eukprot:c16649_g1_i1 orf=128-4696(+)
MAGGEEDENMEALDKARDESSDDDIEIVPKSLDNYWLEHGDETPVSFASLPYFKTGEETVPDKVVYVRGTQDNGMRLYMRAVAWKLELTKDIKPVFHLKTEKYWIQLLKPRKSYEETIRSIISVAQFLNYALINPNDPESAVWSHVKDVFMSWEVAPSRNDLSSHLLVVRHIVASDECLAAASALQTLDTGVSKKRLASSTEDGRQGSRKGMYVSDDEDDVCREPELQPDQKRGKFEVDDINSGEEMDGYGVEADTDDVGDLSETVCCICDNGGTVICCDGPCMRSFHLNKGAGGADDSRCSTLGFSKHEAERMDKFFCPNCKFKKHQCYVCGELGCSDVDAGAAQEVFVCDAAMCGHFYHPSCVAALISDSSEQDIKEGKGFVCPMHKCFKCGKGEVKEEKDLQFGVCRRCPRVWHRKCLPFSVPNDDSENDDENDEPQRAWDNLLPNRLLVYCKRHTIITKLGTPARNHVKFPEGSLPSTKIHLVKSKAEQQEKKSKLMKLGSKKDLVGLKNAAGQKSSKLSVLDGPKKKKNISSAGQGRVLSKAKLDSDGLVSQVSGSKASEQHVGPFLIKGRTDVAKQDWSSQEDSQKPSKPPSLKLERSNSTMSKPSTPRESALRQLQEKSKPPVAKAIVIDNQTKSLVNDIIERTKALVTIESVLKKHDIPACYRRHSKNPDKKYSLFKIESITKGMRKAVETLENGGSIEDAKAKCSPEFIRFIELCRNDLRVYLSPFLHGARYTSYGRHFTKSEKLEEIVDRLHWYVEKGDMIVDFCCGANEFSLFMRRKLEQTGKKCDYKNFDLIQTNNDFNFSKRDWFQVKKEELPDGDRLIMGLNPPFGVKGHLANQFIDHALKFRPKLIVLIVPKETERLDWKRDSRYDLVWEDSDLLSGQSFYLPGSVDVDEKPLNDWNVVAPPLYIWSRPDWTPKHKNVALSKGHISADSGPRFAGSPWRPPSRPSSPLSLPDIGVDQNESVITSIEQNKNYIKLVQPEIMDEQIGVQETGPKLDRSRSAKLKDQDKKSREPLKSKSGDDSAIVLDTQVKDSSLNSSKVKSAAKSANKDVSAPQKLPEEKRLESSKKVSEGSQANQNSNKDAKKGELLKRSSEEQGHSHAQKIFKAKLNSQDSPEKTRHSSETRYDASRKDRKSNDRYDRGDDTRTDPTHDGHQWKRASEKHRLSTEADLGGRRSTNRHDKYESSRRKTPDRYDRHGMSRHGEDRKASPERERSQHSSMANEQKKGSPDKSWYSSSVVDLAQLFPSNDAKKDRSRDHEDFRRKSAGKDYQDSTSYRGGSPDRRYVSEDSKRSWVNIDSYHGSSDNHLRTKEHLNMDYKNSGLPRNSYDDIAHYGMKHSEAQVNSLGKHYYDHEPLGVRRQDAYDVQMSGGYDDATFSRQSRRTDFYQPEQPREMLDMNYRSDRYGVPVRPEGPFRVPAGVGVSALPEQSFQPPWPGSMPPSGLYPSVYGSQVQQQAPLGLGNPPLLSTHGHFDDRLPQPQINRPQYPPSQGRFPGQANQQFSGGWFDD